MRDLAWRHADPAIQSLYAELLDRLLTLEGGQPEFENGSLVRKVIHGRAYWYFQPGRRDRAGKQTHRYIGAGSDPAVVEMVERARADLERLAGCKRLAAMLRREGFKTPQPVLGDALAAMARAGYFRSGACLVGTLAYQAFEPMLGVRYGGRAMQTMDTDVARRLRVSGAAAITTPLPELLAGIDPTFRPVPALAPGRQTGSFINARNLRVDVLTPQTGKPFANPPEMPGMGTAAMPLKFLDYLLSSPIQAALLHGSGVLVNVPAPERFAVHKLVIQRERGHMPAKAAKDMEQARTLLAVLGEVNPLGLEEALGEAAARGPKWRANLAFGLGKLPPDERGALGGLCGELTAPGA